MLQDAAGAFSRASSSQNSSQASTHEPLKIGLAAETPSGTGSRQQLSSMVPLPFASYEECNEGGFFIAKLAIGNPEVSILAEAPAKAMRLDQQHTYKSMHEWKQFQVVHYSLLVLVQLKENGLELCSRLHPGTACSRPARHWPNI